MSNSPLYSPNASMGSLDVADQMAKHAAMMNSPSVMIGHSASANVSSARYPYMNPKQMICMRLRVAEYSEGPFEFMECHVGSDEVTIFVMVNGQPVILTDGKELFPSDALITKLNLLRK